MNAQELIRRLHKERLEWKNSGDAPELGWTLRGIDIARRTIHALAREERMRDIERRPRLARWLAGDLFRAIDQALAYLGRGDRAKAIATLASARDAVRDPRQSPEKKWAFLHRSK